tara:strand:+ start:587 stop:769 length:183 start_codon:yes stop_codon:yes gene_type:complete
VRAFVLRDVHVHHVKTVANRGEKGRAATLKTRFTLQMQTAQAFHQRRAYAFHRNALRAVH